MKNLWWSWVAGLLLAGCTENPPLEGYVKNEAGWWHQLHAFDERSGKVTPGEYLQFSMEIYTLQGDLIRKGGSGEAHSLITHRYNPSAGHADLETVLGDFFEGDSASVLLHDTALKKFGGACKIQGTDRAALLKVHFKIHAIYDEAAYLRMQQGEAWALEQREINEQVVLFNYLWAEGIDSSCYFDGVYVVPISKSNGMKPKAMEYLRISYRGHPLGDTTVVDDSGKQEAVFDFQLGRPNIVIKGLETGLYHIKEHQKARIIIPSQLAFGARGVKGLVPAYTTMIYEVELHNIKKE